MKLTAELRKNELFYNLESERNGQMWDGRKIKEKAGSGRRKRHI